MSVVVLGKVMRASSARSILKCWLRYALSISVLVVASATCSSIQAAPTPSVTLENGRWAQFVVPADSTEFTVRDLFADELPEEEYGSSWALYLYDASIGQYANPGIDGNLPQGAGFWMVQFTGASVTLSLPADIPEALAQPSAACADTRCAAVQLYSQSDEARYNLVGSALSDEVQVSDVRFRASTQSAVCLTGCTLSEAVDNGFLYAPLYHFDSASESYVNLAIGGTIGPWKGMWVATQSSLGDNPSELLFPGNAAHGHSQPDDLPFVDVSKEPAIGLGSDTLDIRPTTQTTGEPPANSGQFRTVCRFSHMSNNDPIVFPNQEGVSHHHTFFGNVDIDHTSTPESVATSGASTCAGGIGNRSAYWVPSMVDTATNTPLKPSFIMVYYKTQVSDAVNYLPEGLRIIAKPHTNGETTRYTCNDDYDTRKFDEIPACSIGETLQYALDFPNCWNGGQLDSPDHTSHMAFTNWDEPCPPSHPVRIPNITYNVHYDVESDISNWRLSSDSPSVSPGSSIHGDWINGWDTSVSRTFVDSCLRAERDCHGYLLGNGTLVFDKFE